jgi:hypothetical protein
MYNLFHFNGRECFIAGDAFGANNELVLIRFGTPNDWHGERVIQTDELDEMKMWHAN